jgi:hypothetical protein
MQTLRQKLEKCRKTLEAHVSRGATPAAQRSMDLIDRYNGLRNQKMDSQASFDEWVLYCQANGFDYRHDAGDFFA